MHPALRAQIPPQVVGFDTSAALNPDPLYPEEEAYLARAVDKRRREFALGRSCARRALRALGVEIEAMVPLPDRSPPWPPGYVGSITHAEGYVGALAARRADVAGLGLDAEMHGRIHPGMWRQIATAREQAWLDAAGDPAASGRRATLLFSAKEAFYKAQFCLSQAWVGFLDVELTAHEGTFQVVLSKDIEGLAPAGTRYVGRYAHTTDHVLTTCVIPWP